MRSRVLEPLQDLQPFRARERAERLGVEHHDDPVLTLRDDDRLASDLRLVHASARAWSTDGRPISAP